MSVAEFLERIYLLKNMGITYRTGGSGIDGTCDCIGLVMYGLGKKYDMHSSNYFARYQMENMQLLKDGGDCYLGMIVFKSRGLNDEGYKLNASYQAGGRYDKDNLLDYYHVGVVTCVDPLVITHCTSTSNANGITEDSKLANWMWGGKAKDIEYNIVDAVIINQTETAAYKAMVESNNEKGVNLREAASATGKYMCRIPENAMIDVLEETTVQYSKVHYINRTRDIDLIGYCARRFLVPINAVTVDRNLKSRLMVWYKQGEALINELGGDV